MSLGIETEPKDVTQSNNYFQGQKSLTPSLRWNCTGICSYFRIRIPTSILDSEYMNDIVGKSFSCQEKHSRQKVS